jgi:hypothetical protein
MNLDGLRGAGSNAADAALPEVGYIEAEVVPAPA